VKKLNDLLASDGRIAVQLRRVESISRISTAMHSHAACQQLQIDGLSLFAELILQSASTAETVASAGMIKWACAMIGMHKWDQCVQESCCRLLRRFAVFSKHLPAIIEAGGVVLMCRSMEENLLSTRIQCDGYTTLRLLACYPEVLSSIASMMTFDFICSGLLAQQTSEELQRDGCALLERLGASSPQNCSAAAESGALRVLCAAMGAYPNNAAIQAYACAALENFVRSEAARLDVIIELGGATLVAAALAAHPGSAAVQEHGTSMAASLCSVGAKLH